MLLKWHVLCESEGHWFWNSTSVFRTHTRTSPSNNQQEPASPTVGHPKQVPPQTEAAAGVSFNAQHPIYPCSSSLHSDLNIVDQLKAHLFQPHSFIYRYLGEHTNVLYKWWSLYFKVDRQYRNPLWSSKTTHKFAQIICETHPKVKTLNVHAQGHFVYRNLSLETKHDSSWRKEGGSPTIFPSELIYIAVYHCWCGLF